MFLGLLLSHVRSFSFLPILSVYPLIFCDHFVGPRCGDGLWIMGIIGLPLLLCVPVFVGTFVLAVIIVVVFYPYLLNAHCPENRDPE